MSVRTLLIRGGVSERLPDHMVGVDLRYERWEGERGGEKRNDRFGELDPRVGLT